MNYRPIEDYSSFFHQNNKRPKYEWYCEKCDDVSDGKECQKCKAECIKVGARRFISRAKRERIFKRDVVCKKCGYSGKLTIDHIIPISKGGSNEDENLQVLCQKCNVEKGNKL